MADIQIHSHPDGAPAAQILVNGVDLSEEVYGGIRLVEVGEHPFSEIGLQLVISVSSLQIDGTDASTDSVISAADAVRSICGIEDVREIVGEVNA